MRMRMVLVLLVAIFAARGEAGAQGNGAGGNEKVVRPYLSSVTDPACPVTDGAAPIPVTNELRVLYFPTAYPEMTIHEPKSLVLHIAFDEAMWGTDFQNLHFARRDDGVWQATVPLTTYKNKYAIYWVEEPDTKQADTNDGKYFEVLFCNPRGEHPDRTIQYQAESYGGRLEPHGFNRPTNYAKARKILEEHIHPPESGGWLISSLWLSKLLEGGETQEVKAALVSEIRQFVGEHAEDNFGLVDALNFVAYHDWVPVELGSELAEAIQKHEVADSNFDAHLMLIAGRVSVEKDAEKRLMRLRELVAKYPDSQEAESARTTLFVETTDLAERERLYPWMRAKYPKLAIYPVRLADAYLSANVKLPEAMSLLAEADRLLDEDLADPAANIERKNFALEEKKSITVLRADLLTRMGKPKAAIALLEPSKEHFRRAHSFYVLGTALEKTGRRREALEAYTEGAVRPGESQREASAAMERLWFKLKMGDKAALMSRTEARSEHVFHGEEYKPKLISRPAPELDVKTIGGEHFTLSSLHGTAFVVNFWATWCGPCVYELKGLEEFQAKHPEVVVLTMVKDDTEAKDLQDVLKEQRVTKLRIAEVPSGLFDRYGALGVPHTFVVDESGVVRVHHFEGLGDATKYLEADFAAIRDAGAGR
jgi:thiol-disulfide isomerase/thioredoxin